MISVSPCWLYQFKEAHETADLHFHLKEDGIIIFCSHVYLNLNMWDKENPEFDFPAYFYSNWNTMLDPGEPLNKYVSISAPLNLTKMWEHLSSSGGRWKQRVQEDKSDGLLLIPQVPGASVSYECASSCHLQIAVENLKEI